MARISFWEFTTSARKLVPPMSIPTMISFVDTIGTPPGRKTLGSKVYLNPAFQKMAIFDLAIPSSFGTNQLREAAARAKLIIRGAAGVAELADAADSKSAAGHPAWGFNSPLQHQIPRPHDFATHSRRNSYPNVLV